MPLHPLCASYDMWRPLPLHYGKHHFQYFIILIHVPCIFYYFQKKNISIVVLSDSALDDAVNSVRSEVFSK